MMDGAAYMLAHAGLVRARYPVKTSQPRVAKIERAATDVSLDQLVRAFTAAGGKVVVKATTGKTSKASAGTRSKKAVKPGGQVVLELETSK